MSRKTCICTIYLTNPIKARVETTYVKSINVKSLPPEELHEFSVFLEQQQER